MVSQVFTGGNEGQYLSVLSQGGMAKTPAKPSEIACALFMFRLSRGFFIKKFVKFFGMVKSDIGEEVNLKCG